MQDFRLGIGGEVVNRIKEEAKLSKSIFRVEFVKNQEFMPKKNSPHFKRGVYIQSYDSAPGG